MKNTLKKVSAVVMVIALLTGGLAVPSQDVQAASKKVSITREVNVTVGKTVKIKLKNNKKKVTWKITKGKNLIKITQKTKTYATVKGIKTGTAKVQAVVGKKKYTCTMTVSDEKKQPTPTKKPDIPLEPRVIEYDGTNINEIWNANEPVAVVVKEGVSGIKASAFEGCSNLISVILPEGLIGIAKHAFYGCSNLKSITFPESLTIIGDGAFKGCSSLDAVTLPNSVTSIGIGAFQDCNSLTSIDLPEGLTGVMEQTFWGCSSLVSIKIPSKVTDIEYCTFADCSSLTNIMLPESLTSIGALAFEHCSSLISIIIPGNITYVRFSAFYYCDSLLSITWRGTNYTSVDDFIKRAECVGY